MRSLPAHSADGGPAAASVAAAVAALQAGELVILPTDTVYGLAADIARPDAVRRLFAAKQRPLDKPIAILAASTEQAGGAADLASPLAQDLIRRGWPGALTVVARARTPLPEGVGSHGTVGVRVPDDAVVQAICAALGRPLAVTSANRSGSENSVTLQEAVCNLERWATLALDGGPCRVGTPSIVVDCTGAQLVVLRGTLPGGSPAAVPQAGAPSQWTREEQLEGGKREMQNG